jgi:hypothetical protein
MGFSIIAVGIAIPAASPQLLVVFSFSENSAIRKYPDTEGLRKL